MDFYISRIKIESFLKEAKTELSDDDFATLNSIFNEKDVKHYNNSDEKDGLLDNEEFASFEEECKKIKICLIN